MQQAHSCNSSALQTKMVLFINLLGEALTLKLIEMEAPSDGLLTLMKTIERSVEETKDWPAYAKLSFFVETSIESSCSSVISSVSFTSK